MGSSRVGRISAQSYPFADSDLTIWTIGHSTRTWDEFVGLLDENRIGRLADVRHFPSSRRVPWTTKASLAASLEAHGVAYEHFEDLGGYRKPVADSPNRGWRSLGFRGYADHMASPPFEAAVGLLLALAETKRTAVMCAEAVPWKCHRSLLSDALEARGIEVVHILGRGQTQEHQVTRFAKVHRGRVTYPEPPRGL